MRALPASLPWSDNGITTYNGPSGGSVSLWGGRSATYEQIVFSQPWIYAAVRTFYLAIAACPRRSTSGSTADERKRVRDHDLAKLLRRPVPWRVGAFDRKGALAFNLFTHGNHLELKLRPGEGPRPPVELWPIPWPWVQEKKDSSGQTTEYRIGPTASSATYITLLPKDVVHYRLMGGRSPLEPLRRTLGIEDAATDWQLSRRSTRARRSAAPSPRTSCSRTAPSRGCAPSSRSSTAGPAARRSASSTRASPSTASRSRPPTSGVGETRKASREETAACYGIPAPMIGILDHATYSNITELRRSFYVDTVAPYLHVSSRTPSRRSSSTRCRRGCARASSPSSTWARSSSPIRWPRRSPSCCSPRAGTTSSNDNRKLKRLDPIGDPTDPANPYNQPRVPANLLDPRRRPTRPRRRSRQRRTRPSSPAPCAPGAQAHQGG